MIKFFKNLFNGLITAGIIIVIIGIYYLLIKAGIPYQDAPTDLQIEYAINQGIGDELMRIGFLATFLGIILRILTGICGKRKVS